MKLIYFLVFIIFIQTSAQAQTFAWARSMGGATTAFTPSDLGYRIKTDSLDNVYTVGFFTGVADFDPGPLTYNLTAPNIQSGRAMFIQKLDSTGNLLWAKQFISDSSSWAQGLELDASLNIYITGVFQGIQDVDPGTGVVNLTSLGGSDMFLLKLDKDGNFVWVKQIGGLEGQGGNRLCMDGFGNLIVLGHFQSTADFDPGAGIFNLTALGTTDIFVCKFNSAGNFAWAKQIGATGVTTANSLSLDGAGNIFLTGTFNSTVDFDPGPAINNLTAAANDIYVVKLDVNGNLKWAKQMISSLSSSAYEIQADKNGNVYYTGSFGGTVDFDPGVGISSYTAMMNSRDMFLSKLDSLGNFIWVKQIAAKNQQESYALGLDTLSNCYITGYFADTVDFDPGTSVHILIAKGEDDLFIQKLDSAGRFVWAVSFESGGSGPGRSWGYSIDVSKQGHVHATGMFGNSVDFNPGPGIWNLTPTGIEDIFVLKLNQASCSGSPLLPGAIAGSNAVSVGQTTSYSISPVQGALIYYWSITGGGIITIDQHTLSISVNWTTAGTHIVSVNSGNSCGNSNNQTLNVAVSVATAVVNPDNEFQIKITPNPSNKDFYLVAKSVNNKSIKVDVINLLGERVLSLDHRSINNNYFQKLDLGKLPASMYKVRVIIDKKVYLRSIIKI